MCVCGVVWVGRCGCVEGGHKHNIGGDACYEYEKHILTNIDRLPIFYANKQASHINLKWGVIGNTQGETVVDVKYRVQCIPRVSPLLL